jgi:hypothetical protein
MLVQFNQRAIVVQSVERIVQVLDTWKNPAVISLNERTGT